MSVILNYIEGYARFRNKVHKNFLEIAYGSLKESQYLVEFAHKEGWVDKTKFTNLHKTGDEIGAMLWATIHKLP